MAVTELECSIHPINLVRTFSLRELKSGRIFTALCRYYKFDKEFRDSINSQFGITNKLCNWCSGTKKENYRLNNIIFSVINTDITISSIEYSDIHYCGLNDCKEIYKTYNSNSAYKIMLNHNLGSEIEAKHWIRNNNKSPFYKENHESGDKYSESQRRNQDKEKWALMTEKANFSRSLSGYIKRYGEIEGRNRFNETCKSKGHSIENFVEKYGEIEGINRYNNLVKFKVASNGSYFGIISYTDKGERLLSSYELSFYHYIKVYNLLDYYDVGIYYGGKYGHKSDFYFEILDLHVEIAGMMHHQHYKEKMELKKKLYKDKCLIILPENIEQTVIELSKKIREIVNE